jgi:uncharacterized protein (TIGR03435 family)
MAPRFALALLVVCAGPQLAQEVSTGPPAVVSIKSSRGGDDPGGFRMIRGRFVAENVTVRLLITVAYRVQPSQVSGGQRWVDRERFDVEGKLDGPDTRNDQEWAMVRALLADRFKLVLHKDEGQTPAYALVVAGKTPKMKRSADQSPGGTPTGGVHIGAGNLVGTGIRLGLIASLLGTRLGRPVVDRTNLPDRYDVDLRWTPDVGEAPTDAADALPRSDPSGPSLFTAIQQQLGLKLIAIKAPSGLLAIDEIEKPAVN